MAKILKKIKNFLWKYIPDHSHPTYKLVYCGDVPGTFNKETIYILGSNKFPWQIAFLCPCNCGDLIQLNLLKEARPSWNFKVDKRKKITLKPSVWRKVGCKSHFLVQKGRIVWVTARD